MLSMHAVAAALHAGMSMFSTKNGLYERARARFKITDGIKLFSYPFYKQRRMDVQVRNAARPTTRRLPWLDTAAAAAETTTTTAAKTTAAVPEPRAACRPV